MEIEYGLETDVAVSFSLLPSQPPASHIDPSVVVWSTVQTWDDVDSRSMTPHEIDPVATASLGGAIIGQYILIAAVFAMIVFLWVQ